MIVLFYEPNIYIYIANVSCFLLVLGIILFSEEHPEIEIHII